MEVSIVGTTDGSVGDLVGQSLESLFDAFQLVLPYDRIGYATIDTATDTVTETWLKSKDPDRVKLAVGHCSKLAVSSLASVAESGEPRVIDDLPQYLAHRPDSGSTKLIVAEGINSSLTCPVTVDGRVVGFLFFSSNEVGAYGALEHGALLGLAKMLSATVAQDLQLKEKTALAETLTQQALRDPLTSLLNRRGLRLVFDRWREAPVEHSLIMVDLDGFKAVNDQFGHQLGDEVLNQVADVLLRSVRSTDFAARVGGDEFAVLLTDPGASQQVAARVIDRISALGHGVTASVGMVTYETHMQAPESVLAAADSAMYQAKRAGGNRPVAVQLSGVGQRYVDASQQTGTGQDQYGRQPAESDR